jgi:hypothetical protein
VEDSISHCNHHETHSRSQEAGVFTYLRILTVATLVSPVRRRPTIQGIHAHAT